MTWRELLNEGECKLRKAGIADWKTDAWYLFESAFGIARARYYLCAQEETPRQEREFAERLKLYREDLSRRSGREPLQHILGEQEFMGLPFYVNKNVLIPRQDTETLVETVLADRRDRDTTILDMCTGSGCIAVSLAALGGYENVTAADISEEALAIAQRNAERILSERRAGKEPAGPGPRILFRKSDLFSEFPEPEKFDVIVCNPPYIPSGVIGGLEPEVRDFEPRLALDGDADGLMFYRRLAAECGRRLKAGGSVYFEIGYDQAEAVRSLLAAGGFTDISVIRDLAGKDRVVRALRGSAPGATREDPPSVSD